MFFSRALFQENTGEAHRLNKSKPRRNGKQDTIQEGAERTFQNKGKGQSQKSAVPQAGETQRLRRTMSPRKTVREKNYMTCLEM